MSKEFLLSNFVAETLAQELGPTFAQQISSLLPFGRDTDDHLFRLWFFATMVHGGVSCYDDEDEIFYPWEAQQILHFDPDAKLTLEMTSQWLAPKSG
ncbi:hypothetical protein F441_09298 [Phytophthora nicotianae CJ01A1]|nr:hypothetical protein PPTG_23027 [Phytophthora nicotianae INRA-310]ETK86195.1 hypothetical protein L915_09157 [Phytophthora nicotianae]ETO74936.1 hypothetical protein F444_09422 [Phytophthora nicotianae P1976]ETP16062.1 hypothetical protein F441_09298 [Phytophthora nicotianae CJ01A1]ETP44123.1 hypothetical protein F442_09261 [Phytophthora nicotianae P10297]ETL39619.1 hypothetical protein L916_09068 [Phytophthora nicotianae]